MTISFTTLDSDVLFAGTVHLTANSPEKAAELAASLNEGLMRVIADLDLTGSGVEADEGQFVPFGTKSGKTPTDTVNAAFKPFTKKPAAKDGDKKDKKDDLPPWLKPKEKSKAKPVDPDGDGDDDSSAATDTDHDYWSKDGKQLKALPGKPLPKKK